MAGEPRVPAAIAGRVQTERLDREVRRSVLPGGTVVLTERMDSVRSVSVGFWFRRGTAHEDPMQRGIAHLLEHMVFKGTRRRSARELASAVEDTGGSLDAYTTHEHTALQVRVPSARLLLGLDVLADLAFSPLLRQSDLDLEREVVQEEIARVEETPDDLVFELHSEFMYDGHPYGSSILGTRETIEAIDISDLRRFHAGAYRPRQLIIAAAGRVAHDDLVAHLLEALPEDTDPAAPCRVADVDAMAVGTRRVRRSGSRQVHVAAGGRGVGYTDPLRHAAIVVGQALGGGMSSRLFQRIREDLGLAYSVFSFQSFYGRGGHVGAYLGTRPESVDAAREALLEELRRMSDRALDPGELRDVREQIKGQIILSLESPAARMHRLAMTALHDEPYRSLDELAETIDGVGPDQAAEAAAMYHPDRVAILELWPA